MTQELCLKESKLDHINALNKTLTAFHSLQDLSPVRPHIFSSLPLPHALCTPATLAFVLPMPSAGCSFPGCILVSPGA